MSNINSDAPPNGFPDPANNRSAWDTSSETAAASQQGLLSSTLTPSLQYNGPLHSMDTAATQAHQAIASPTDAPTSLSARLKLQTDHLEGQKGRDDQVLSTANIASGENSQQTVFNAGLPVRSSSIRSVLGSRAHRSDSLSPASAISSPAVGPLVEMTPLPSPISSWGFAGFKQNSIECDVDPEATVAGQTRDSPPRPIPFTRSSPKKKRIPDNLEQIYDASGAAHARNRSTSEYVPEGMQVPRSRNIVVSTSGVPSIGLSAFSPPDEDHMHREQYLAVQRGLAISVPTPPTPPDSNRGKDSAEIEGSPSTPIAIKKPLATIYEACMVPGGKLRQWRALRRLGQGTFSTVMLATSEEPPGMDSSFDEANLEDQVSPRALVAIKICEQGPAGGADEKKMETSIKREMEIMKSIHHPSLVHLKAASTRERQTFLVLNYCAGGDLFELANSELDILSPSLIRRIFAELVAAVRYLHEQYIVHRDIKLESRILTCYNNFKQANARSRCPCKSSHCCFPCDRRLAILSPSCCNFDRPWSGALDSPTTRITTSRH